VTADRLPRFSATSVNRLTATTFFAIARFPEGLSHNGRRARTFRRIRPNRSAKPTLVPNEAVIESTNRPPDIVVCLGGGLHFSERTLRSFPKETVLAGFALSDPLRPRGPRLPSPHNSIFFLHPGPADAARLRAAPDPGAALRSGDGPRAVLPERAEPECDVVSTTASGHRTGTRSPPRSPRAFAFRVHAYAGETAWSVPVFPPLDTPDALRTALNRSRLALRDRAPGRRAGQLQGHLPHHTAAPFFAARAACRRWSIVRGLASFFAPGTEIADIHLRGDIAAEAERSSRR